MLLAKSKPRIIRVISGGQTGADMAGLLAAQKCDIPTGGWVPKGWLTELGPSPTLARFGLVQHSSPDYPPRTKSNIKDADATIIIADTLDRGSGLTQRLCAQVGRPCRVVHPQVINKLQGTMVDITAFWLFNVTKPRGAVIVNIAGNRESKAPGIEKLATAFLVKVFKAFNKGVERL
jgi:hypothetical protein